MTKAKVKNEESKERREQAKCVGHRDFKERE